MIKNARADFRQITDAGSSVCNQDVLPLVFILSTLACVAVAAKSQLAVLMAAPLAIWFVGVPLLDKYQLCAGRGLGEPKGHTYTSPTEVQIAATLSILTLMMLALSEPLSTATMCLLGVASGLLVVVALHYAVGSPTKGINLCSKGIAAGAMAIGLVPQFCRIERQLHERAAATPEDPFSARMGESYYRFLSRYIRGVFLPGFRTTRIVGSQDWRGANVRGRLAIIFLFSVYTMSLVYIGGIQLLLFIAAQVVVVAWQLSSFDYIERYGQIRKYDEAGRLEPLNEKHYWHGAGEINNTLLNHRIVRNDDDIRTRPEEVAKKTYAYGFNFLSLMVLSPRLWFRYVNPLLAANVDFDLAKVNLDGDSYEVLMEAYHRAEG